MRCYEKSYFKYITQKVIFLLAITLGCCFSNANSAELATSTKHAQVVNLQLKWWHQFQFAGYYAAQIKGFYASEGLKVNILQGDIKISAVEMVISGKAQYGVSDSEILLDYDQGKPVVVIGAIFQHSPYILLSRHDSKIHTPSDLVGKTVMLGNNQGATQFKAMLSREGINLKSIKIVPHSWNIQDLIDYKVDAISAYMTAEPNFMRSMGVKPGVMSSTNYGVDFYGDTLFTSNKELASNPERVAAFLRASQKGWIYALEHKEEIIAHILKMKGVADRGVTRTILLNEANDMEPLILPNIVEIGHINIGRWSHIANELSNLGLMKKNTNLSNFIYQPTESSKLFSKKNMVTVFLLLSVVLLLAAYWYFKTRQKLRKNDEKLNNEVISRQKTEVKLAAAQAQLSEMFKATAAGIAVTSNRGLYQMANPAYCQMLSFSEDELKKKYIASLIHQKDHDSYLIKVQELLNQNLDSFTHDMRFIQKTGAPLWVRACVTAMRSPNGEVSGLITVAENINDQITIGNKLKQNEYLLKSASYLAQFGGWQLTVEDMKLSWSDEVAFMHDMKAGEVPTLTEAENMVTTEYRDLIKSSLKECIHLGTPYDLEFKKNTATNRLIWVRSVGQAVRNIDGEITHIQGAFQDISKYKNLEFFNHQQSRILESIASNQPLTSVLESCVNLIQDQYPRLTCVINLIDDLGIHLKTGTSVSMPAEYLASINGVKIGPSVGSCGTAAFKRREVIVSDIANDRLWKNYKHLALKYNLNACWSWPIFSSKNLVIGTFAAYSKEISSPTQEQRTSISAIAKTVGIAIEKEKTTAQIHLLESAISRLNDIVLITEAEPTNQPGPVTVFVNDAFEKRTGYSKAEIIGKTPRILQGPKTDKNELKRIHDALDNWEPVRSELINYKKNGEPFWLELDIVPIADATGWYTHWVAVERDITQRKSIELEMGRLNRALRLLSSCNEALMRIKNEELLVNEICKLAVEIGGYKMAWVGYAKQDTNKSILPVGSYGDHGNFLEKLNISWSDSHPRGNGPGGKTIRECKTVVVADIAKEATYPAKKEANEKGYLGLISLPLIHNGQCFGLLAMYASEIYVIADEEIKLLEEMADDLSYGIESIRNKLEQEKMQTAINKVASSVSIISSNQFFEQLTKNMIFATDADAGFIAKFISDKPSKAATLCAVVDNNSVEKIVYDIDDNFFNQLLTSSHFTFSQSIVECCVSKMMLSLEMKDYAGQGLLDSKGKMIGMIFVMKRESFRQNEFLVSTLKIFATRAAAEIERQDYDRHISEQASLLDKAQDAIFVRDMNNRIQFWNQGAERLYGWTKDEALGQSVVDLIYINHQDYLEFDEILRRTGECQKEVKQKCKDGTELYAEVHWTLVTDEKGLPLSVLCINTDITQRKVAAEKIQHLAFYDALTGLPNRLLLQDRLQHAILSTARSNKYGAILFIDLDNFKKINDTLGHAAGDALLKEISIRFQENTRDSDTVSRLGGDEFIIMLEDLSSDAEDSAIQTKLFAEKVIYIFQNAFEVGGYKHYTTPSIGITMFKGVEQSVTEVLKHADLAMYQAKAAGRNTLRFYDPQMQSAVSSKVGMEADLREAIKNNEFLLHYQPQINDEGQCIGAEALLRWKSETKGMISPAEFIPLAEETLLILPLGEWVLKTACEALVKWEKMPFMANLQLAVNVSVRQFRTPNFVNQVLSIIEATGANPTRLKLELTESLFVENVEDIINKMLLLKQQGILFSLDDFGTGYSSLSYLKRLPLDQLKIDQSFVQDVMTDNHDATIARSIITLAKNLGLEVIAEGVELLEQKGFLQNEGCYLYQGYYFSRPLPLEGIEDFVKNTCIAESNI